MRPRRNSSSSARTSVLVRALDAGSELDDRLDLLAPLVVGNAEHGHVGHPRMGDQHALDLGRDRC